MSEYDYTLENQTNYIPCGAPLSVKNIVRCTCTRPKNHKGRHSASYGHLLDFLSESPRTPLSRARHDANKGRMNKE